MSLSFSGRRAFLRSCAAAALALGGAESCTADERERNARALLESRIAKDGPGAMVAVARDGHLLFERGFGRADVARRRSFTRKTVFDLASCSKQFTAAAVLQLWDQGRLDPADDVRRYLPELRRSDTRPMRVADLLHMTSGLPDYTTGMGNLAPVTNADVLAWTAKQPLRAPIGSRFIYNDTDYALLALLVERTSALSFREYLRRNIFAPARMEQADVLEKPGQKIPSRAEGYTTKSGKTEPARYDTCVYGDGQVMCSAGDLLRWDHALRRGKLLRPETLDYAYRSGKLDSGAETGYACGWHVAKTGRVVEHGGGWAGTSVFIRRDLETGLTVLVLSNLDTFGAGKVGGELVAAFQA